jgi:hypothetical protein
LLVLKDLLALKAPLDHKDHKELREHKEQPHLLLVHRALPAHKAHRVLKEVRLVLPLLF